MGGGGGGAGGASYTTHARPVLRQMVTGQAFGGAPPAAAGRDPAGGLAIYSQLGGHGGGAREVRAPGRGGSPWHTTPYGSSRSYRGGGGGDAQGLRPHVQTAFAQPRRVIDGRG